MDANTTRAHWDKMYAARADAQLSWMQHEPATSLALIRAACPSGRVIDVGGGTSPLARCLLDAGYAVAVLDISLTALDRARALLGGQAAQIAWITADVTADVTAAPDIGTFDVWHDRAVFHFLVDPRDRARYVDLLTGAVGPGGHAIIATFTLDGPGQCSGLPVRRYDGESLSAELGPAFARIRTVPEDHLTPGGTHQPFQFSLFRRT